MGRVIRKYTAAIGFVVGFFWTAMPSWAGESDSNPFTVKDSIEMSYIVNPTISTVPELRDQQPIGAPVFSQDRKYFLLVTQRGILSSNKIEATLWLFNRQAVSDYLSKLSAERPVPKALVQLRATSNTPVISDVRWLQASHAVAFLGKNDTSVQQLFVADADDGALTQVTSGNAYVSAYDIGGNAIVYTTLIPDEDKAQTDGFTDVTGKNIYSLLFSKRQAAQDLDEGSLQTRASRLHVLRDGQELPLSFVMDGMPLRLFIPILSLSPDGRYLIAVAPVHEIPPRWADYQPYSRNHEFLHLTPANKYALADENPWKAERFAIVDLQTGIAVPLVDAPVGRGMLYPAPTKAFWLPDGRRAILSNTYLPRDAAHNDKEQVNEGPVVAMVDTTTRAISAITRVRQAPNNANAWWTVGDVSWNPGKEEIGLKYTGDAGNAGAPRPERFKLQSDHWVKVQESAMESGGEGAGENLEMSVEQELNQPPVLAGRLSGGERWAIIWDPNPQLETINIGHAGLYHWRDKDGNRWTGILALPPNYDPRRRYPLVIQTHGYEPTRFFTDGEFTTGSGGRALTAKGIVVLQMSEMNTHSGSPKDAPDQIAGFESAIGQLSRAGMVDPRHVGIIGFSYTCFHVLYAITHRPDLFEAASITDGVNMSYVQYIMSTDYPENGVQVLSAKINGGLPFGQGLMNWLRDAPNFNLDKVHTPLLISSLEPGELLSQWETYSGLRKLSKPVDMVWLRSENAPHILVQPYHRFVSQQGGVDWFDFWLNDREDPSLAKTEQYERWHKLRELHEEDMKNRTKRTRLGRGSRGKAE